MMRNGKSTSLVKGDWASVARLILSTPPGQDARIELRQVPHPSSAGFREASGWPMGQNADWRLMYSDGRGLHVKEYDDHYLVHWDQCDPAFSAVGHLAKDTPRQFVVGSMAVGAGGGAAVAALAGGDKSTFALLGALGAGVLSALMLNGPGA